MKRIIIYPKDVALITGKSERYGRVIIKKIKTDLNKKDHQQITITEFCNFLGINKSEIQNML